MIRYHKVIEKPRPEDIYLKVESRFLVSSYRRPRGFVQETTQTTEHRETFANYAHVRYEAQHGWRPVSFDGKVGKFYRTRKEAALALLSRMDMHCPKYIFAGHISPNPAPFSPRDPVPARPRTWLERILSWFDIHLGL